VKIPMSRFDLSKSEATKVAGAHIDQASEVLLKSMGASGEWQPLLVLVQPVAPHAVVLFGAPDPSDLLLEALGSEQANLERSRSLRDIEAAKYALRHAFGEGDFAVVGRLKQSGQSIMAVMSQEDLGIETTVRLLEDAAKTVRRATVTETAGAGN
jgi:hypothetical protein